MSGDPLICHTEADLNDLIRSKQAQALRDAADELKYTPRAWNEYPGISRAMFRLLARANRIEAGQ